MKMTPAEKQSAYRKRQERSRQEEFELKSLPPLHAVPSMPSRARWKKMKQNAVSVLDSMKDEMQSYFDDRSDKWQESDKGSEFQEELDTLDEVISQLDD